MSGIYNLQLEQGADLSLHFSATDDDDIPLPDFSEYEAELCIWQDHTQASPVFRGTVVSGHLLIDDEGITFNFSKEDVDVLIADGLTADTFYSWNLLIVSPDGFDIRLLEGRVGLNPEGGRQS